MLLYTIMMVLLVASTSLQQTLERRPTPFSKHKRRISVILENNSPLQLRQRHLSAGGGASVVDPLPGKSAVHDHDGTAGRQHKPATDTGEASDSFQQTKASGICRPGVQLPSTAQTVSSVNGEILGNFHLSTGGGASVVDPLPGESAVHDHDGTAGRQHKPETDTVEASPFSKHKRRTSVVLENNSPLQLRQRPPQMARFWAISICQRGVEPPLSTPCLVTLLRLSERLAEV